MRAMRPNASAVVRALVGVLAFVVLVGPAAWAADLSVAKPEQVGMSSERLARLTAWLRADVEQGRLPGAVALVARKGRVVYFEAVGFREKATGAALRRDDIFRLYSMTKPMTSVAVMLLRDEGRFDLGDPVSKYLPQLGKLQVGVEQPDAATGQVALGNEVGIQPLDRRPRPPGGSRLRAHVRPVPGGPDLPPAQDDGRRVLGAEGQARPDRAAEDVKSNETVGIGNL